MAGLADYEKFEGSVREIQLGGGQTMTVRGLALSDMTRLFQEHAPDLEALFIKFAKDEDAVKLVGDPKFASKGAATKFGKDLLTTAPDLAAKVIAHAGDEPGKWLVAKRLPFTVQMTALEAISELTFVEEDSLKKAGEVVIRAVAGITNLLTDLNQQRIGSLQLEDKPAS